MNLSKAFPKIKKEYKKIERSVSSKGKKKLKLHRDDVINGELDLQGPEEDYHVVVALGPIGFVKDFSLAVKKLNRVLKPKGKIALACWTKTGKDFIAGQYYFAEKEFFRVLNRFFKMKKSLVLYEDSDRTLRAFVGTKRE